MLMIEVAYRKAAKAKMVKAKDNLNDKTAVLSERRERRVMNRKRRKARKGL